MILRRKSECLDMCTETTTSFCSFTKRHARSVVPCARICPFVFCSCPQMLGLRAWGDDLVVVLFEFLGEKRGFAAVHASSALVQLVLCFWDYMLAVILDQKSPAAVRWLPHREGRCVEASLVQFSHKTHFLVAISSLFVMPRSLRGRLWKRTRNKGILRLVLVPALCYLIEHICFEIFCVSLHQPVTRRLSGGLEGH